MKEMNSVMAITLLVILVIVMIGVGPLITIWSLNAVFASLAIPYTLKTWAGTLLLQMTLGGLFSVKAKL